MPSPGKKIDLNYARKLAENYAKNKLDKPLLKEDTQAVWFSKEILLKALGLDPATDTKDTTGIRFYFGAYEAHTGYPENAADCNMLTLVIVPTGEDTITIQRGTKTETAYLDLIDDPIEGKTQPSYPAGSAKDTNSLYNEGQITPPPKAAIGLGLMDW